LKYVINMLEFIGGVAILAWRVIKLVFTGRANFGLLLPQMAFLGVNSIPISMLVLGFAGAVITLILAPELQERGAGHMMGGLLLVVLLREFIPVFTGVVLAGKIGASITSEIGTMKITEQLDALKALSTDPDWYLTMPRVLAGVLMTPVIAVFAGYAGWYGGFYTAHKSTDISYELFRSSTDFLVDDKDYHTCLIKCMVFSAVIVLTACYIGYRARGGAAGVGRAVTNSVVANIVLLFAFDLLLTAVLF